MKRVINSGNGAPYPWFVGLGIDEAVWDRSTFTQKRNRLLHNEMAGFFSRGSRNWYRGQNGAVTGIFSIDGPLLDAWVSHKSFICEEGDSTSPEDNTRNPGV